MLLPLAIALLPAIASAGEASDANTHARFDTLHQFLQDSTRETGYTGAVSLIAIDGRIVDEYATGFADLKRTVPMRDDAIFRIYSMTKPITSVAALMLVEQGALRLDDPVTRFLPEFRNLRCLCGGTAEHPESIAARIPTIRNLLTHTAGFATDGSEHRETADALNAARPDGARDLADYAARVVRAPLAEQPGTHFHYDGVNTQVLARVIEVASGQTLDAFLRARILAPLRMTDTGFDVPAAQRHRVAELSTTRDGARVLADTPSAREPGARLSVYDNGAGGLYSTVGDYFRFAQMLANGGELDGVRLLSRASVDQMMRDQLAGFAPPITGPNPGEGFGLGGYVVTDVARRGRLGSPGQFGWSGSASTYFTIDREKHLVAILMAQHLPSDGAGELPRLSVPFFNHVYQALP